ncbi:MULTISPECIES: HupE/UreJ family protein [unclassified Variovorax]|uniref:HupE/UreJ family protein n=1 Tax=unclassified Variovorax TaxID=663243 RepID=UPI0015FED7F3|nr:MULTISPECIES: HupE/UreJ family protein [unclassified Variovorax]MBB1600944.1 urease accessory protein UreJ [Variovorax sp. UMC13]MDM0088102.1 HupE/UreJ family protein [Variovorax sp. J22G40]MDM0146175.1 HupE/UreJ family protein [Variovorax sp. J2P1-31]
MRLTRSSCVPSLAAAALGLLPLLASAHVGVDGAAHHDIGFVQGFVHPFTGLDHLAAMVAVGLWSALIARTGRDLLWAPLGFAGMLLAGALLGLAGVQVPAVEPMIAASLLVIGLLVATRLRLPGPVAAAVVGVFAVFHGVAHGYELAGDHGAGFAIAGMVLATALLHTAGIAIGWTLRQRGAWLPRVAGAAVALFGAALLAQLA